MIAEGRNINVTLIFRLDPLRRGHRGLPLRPGGAGRLRGRRPLPGAPAWPRSSSAGSTPRSTAGIEAAWPTGRRRPPGLRGKAAVAQARLAYAPVPRALLRSPVGGPGRQGGPGAAPAVGLDLHQEPGLPRPALRRHPDRPRHRQHHARRHRRRLPRPRHRGPDRRRRRRRRPGPSSTGWPTAGIDMEDVAGVLETEGVASFAASFDDLMDSLDRQGGRPRRRLTPTGGPPDPPHPPPARIPNPPTEEHP